jgi:hypothetical protein
MNTFALPESACQPQYKFMLSHVSTTLIQLQVVNMCTYLRSAHLHVYVLIFEKSVCILLVHTQKRSHSLSLSYMCHTLCEHAPRVPTRCVSG